MSGPSIFIVCSRWRAWRRRLPYPSLPGELEGALRGISPSLLAKRLAQLSDDGLLVRNDAPRRSKSVEYRLTDAGRSLEPVLLGLIRWGSRWMLCGPGDDRIDPRWAPLALRALLEGQPSGRGRVHLDVDGIEVTVSVWNGQRRVVPGHEGRPDATIAAALPVLLAIAAGAMPLHSSGAALSGDTTVARKLLTALPDGRS